MKKTLRIATRGSKLALWQSHFVKAAIEKINPAIIIELVEVVTKGDQEQTQPLTNIGGKSLFVKALQQAILNNEADIAVHSMKDMSVFATEALEIAAVLARADARDAFLSEKYGDIDALPNGAVVGTASPRRSALLKAERPDLQIKLLRGNVDTRLAKLQRGDYDAIILAAAGLDRLGLAEHIRQRLPEKTFVPAIAQGAIAIECRSADTEIKTLLAALNDVATACCVNAERAVNRVIGGDCHTPVGAHAILQGDTMQMHAMLGDGAEKLVRAHLSGDKNKAEALGEKLGQELLAAIKI